MTSGERITWIWVWSAMVVVSLTVIFAIWRYWTVPYAYLNSLQCHRSDAVAARPACERVLSYERATAEMQAAAHLRLASMAKQDNKHDIAISHYDSVLALGRATANDWNERGLSYYSLRQYDRAAQDFRQAAAMNSTEGVYWSNLADAELQLKKYSEAYDHYTTAIANGNDMAEILGNRGWASYQLGNYEKALADYVQAIAQEPQRADNLNERGLVRHALGEYESAVSDYDRSLALKPDNPVILTNRAITYVRMRKIEKASQDLDRAIALDASYLPARLEKSWLLISTGKSGEALRELKMIERLAPLDIFTLEARGRALYDQGLREEAIADAEKAMSLNDQYTWPHQLRSEARQDLDNYEGSIADSTAILRRFPKNIDALVTRATTLQLSGHLDAALGDMQRAIEAAADPAYVYEQRSYLNIYAGRLTEAISDAKQSVALAPQSPDSLNALGWVHIESGAPAAGLLECNRSLSVWETERALRCRAIAYLQLNQVEKALIDADRALALNKNSPNNRIVLGRIDLAQGNTDGALAHFDTALKLRAFDRAAAYMYRGDAHRARGDMVKARLDYQEARKRDLGLYRKALDERLKALTAQ